jgi:hypothetical protein
MVKLCKEILTVFLLFLCISPNWNCSSNSPDDNGTIPSQDKTPKEDPVFQIVILSINGNEYTNQDFKNFFQIQYSTLDLTRLKESILKKIFSTFVDRQMILYKAHQDKMEIPPEDMKSYLADFDVSSAVSTEVLKNNYRIQRYLSLYVYKDVKVSEKEILAYYTRNRSTYRKKTEILLHQIKVNNMEDAIQIRKILLKNPEKFGDIAKIESTSLDAKNRGEMGYFELGVLPKEIENQVFSLKLNTISPIVETPYGYHIFKVTKKRGRRLVPLSQVRESIEDQLMSGKLNHAYNLFLVDLKKKFEMKQNYQDLYLINVRKSQMNENSKGENIK